MKNLFIILALFFIAACGKQESKPLSDILKKNWVPNSVTENGTTVYISGGSGNTSPSYVNFKLNLNEGGSLTLIEVDKTLFNGLWELSSDNKTLSLKNLNPQPTGTTGQIDFTIINATETELKISRKSNNLKTGGTINVYELIAL